MSAKKKATKEEVTAESTEKNNLQWARDTLAEGKTIVLSQYVYNNKTLDHTWLTFDPDVGMFLCSVRASNHADFPNIGTNKRRLFAKEALQYLCVLETSKNENGDPPLIEMEPVIIQKITPQKAPTAPQKAPTAPKKAAKPKKKKETEEDKAAAEKAKKEAELQAKKAAEEAAFQKKHKAFIKDKNKQRAKRKKQPQTGYSKGRSLRFKITSRYEFRRMSEMIEEL